MDKLRLRNYRCFDDTGDIDLKPITLLLGANSSGKSSFIKFFPLLQQSMETRVNGLFLWDGQYVDFKNFKNTVRNGQGEIIIDYTIGELKAQNYYGHRFQSIKNVVVSMTLCEKGEYYDYLKELTIHFENMFFKYLFSKDGRTCLIEANGIKSESYAQEKIIVDYDNNLLPTVRFEVDRKDYKIGSVVPQLALAEVNVFVGRKNRTGIELFLDDRDPDMLSYDYKKNIECLKKRRSGETDDVYEKMANIQAYLMSGQIIRSVNEYFARMSRSFSYVLPLRSIMNRYYRFQNRNVDTIDPDGDNLAMFLNSLSESKFEDFNSWLKEIFHFGFSVIKSEGHVEIYIEEQGKPKRNLVDVGFGYTQILPILTIIWKSIYEGGVVASSRIAPITIAIEQPELHLHPRFQAYFAIMLSKVMHFCQHRKQQVRIIIETHSEVIINKLGQLIYDPEEGVTKDDVNVVLFHANNEGLDKYVHATGYSEDGGLINWPFGFFSEDVYRDL